MLCQPISSEDVYYYSLYDVFADSGCADQGVDEDNQYVAMHAGEVVKKVNEWKQDAESENLTDDEMRYLGKLIAEFIIPGSYKSVVEIRGKETTEHGLFWSKFILFVNSSLDRYSTILKYYEDNRDKLMNQIMSKTTSTNKSNDTPQGTGDFSDDAHVSLLDQGEVVSKSDGDTPIARLKEIVSSYKSIYQLWYNEFKRAMVYNIIEGAN